VGSTSVGIELSDLAVLAVVVTAAIHGIREGWGPLRATRALWICEAVFMGLVIAATIHPLLWQEHYRFLTHLVTAAKFCEYGLLAPALALLVRRPSDVLPVVLSATCWSVAASGWAVLQFAGLVTELEGKRPLQREPSFVGIHDLAALSGAVLVLALAAACIEAPAPFGRPFVWIAGVAGGTGLILSSAVAGAIGVAFAAAAAIAIARTKRLVTPGRTLAVASAAGLAAVGVVLMRSGDIAQSIRAAGVGSEPKPQVDVQSYVHRSLLGYIGIRIFADHPAVGVGWQGSEEFENYRPYLADARRRFPAEPAAAFPSPEHPWGVQNAYLQTLTDLGLVGFGSLLALFFVAVVLGARAALRAPPGLILASVAGLLWLLVAAGVWNGLGIVAGIPLDALTWFGVGLIGAATTWTQRAAS
jgi:O-Antigen ligase